MMKYLLCVVLSFLCIESFAQNGVKYDKYFITGSLSVGRIVRDSFANQNVWLQLGNDSTNKGFLLPRVADTGSVVGMKGMVVFNDKDSLVYMYTNKWIKLLSSASITDTSVLKRKNDSVNSNGYTTVYRNNLKQDTATNTLQTVVNHGRKDTTLNGVSFGNKTPLTNRLIQAGGVYTNPSSTGSDFLSQSETVITGTSSASQWGGIIANKIGAASTGHLTGVFRGVTINVGANSGSTATLDQVVPLTVGGDNFNGTNVHYYHQVDWHHPITSTGVIDTGIAISVNGYDSYATNWTLLHLGSLNSVGGKHNIYIENNGADNVMGNGLTRLGTATTSIGVDSSAADSNVPNTRWVQYALSKYQTKITTGSTSQYIRGDGSLATFPTNVSSFANDAGYLTSVTSNLDAITTNGRYTTTSMRVGTNTQPTGLVYVEAITGFEVFKDSSYSIKFFSWADAANGNQGIAMGHARGTQATPSALNASDFVGTINFQTHNGTSFVTASQIRVICGQNQSTSGRGQYMDFLTMKDNSVTAVPRLAFDSTQGNVCLDPTGVAKVLVGTLTDNGSGGALQVTGSITQTVVTSAIGYLNASGKLIAATPGTNYMATVANARLTGQTVAVGSITAYTPSATSEFMVGAYLHVTAIVTDVIKVSVSYYDETATFVTQDFFASNLGTASISSTGNVGFPTINITAGNGGPITVLTTLTTSIGTITYNVSGTITKLD